MSTEFGDMRTAYGNALIELGEHIEQVWNSKDREMRSLIRKAITPLEVLVHYNTMLEGSV